MSEFTCRNGHIMFSRDRFCPQCGAACAYMDGKSNYELTRREREEEYRRDEDDYNDEITNGEK